MQWPRSTLVETLDMANLRCLDILSGTVLGLACKSSLDEFGEASITLIHTIRYIEFPEVLIFDLVACPDIVTGTLKALLEDPTIIKVIHGSRSDTLNLKKVGVTVRNIFDTQVAYKYVHPNVVDPPKIGYDDLCQLLGLHGHRRRYDFNHDFADPRFWARRPLHSMLIPWLALEICELPELYKKMKQFLKRKPGRWVSFKEDMRIDAINLERDNESAQ